jgi:hypothetical protein
MQTMKVNLGREKKIPKPTIIKNISSASYSSARVFVKCSRSVERIGFLCFAIKKVNYPNMPPRTFSLDRVSLAARYELLKLILI